MDYRGSHQVTVFSSEVTLLLIEAIKSNKLDDLRLVYSNSALVNSPLIAEGSLAGFTSLHIACLEQQPHVAAMLVKDFHADVNVIADNGAQPIHLAALLDNTELIVILLRANADVSVGFGREVFQYRIDPRLSAWRDDFGDKITIMLYYILHTNEWLVPIRLARKTNCKVISRKNKTLLMYALENIYIMVIAQYILPNPPDEEYINHRDNDGKTIIHYFLDPKIYNGHRYIRYEHINMFSKYESFLEKIIEHGVDIYALVNDDPNTLLINVAAYRGVISILQVALPHYTSIAQSKALYYAMLPYKDSEIFHNKLDLTSFRTLEPYYLKIDVRMQRKRTIIVIVKDLIYRRSFGLKIPESEEKLLNKLIQIDEKIATMNRIYERDVIGGLLKNRFIHYGDKTFSYYDLISLSLDYKKLRKMVRDKGFVDKVMKCQINFGENDYFQASFRMRINKAYKRVELIEKLKQIPQLRKTINLPFELILDISEFLTNFQLEKFINAFYNN